MADRNEPNETPQNVQPEQDASHQSTEDVLTLTLQYHSQSIELSFESNATISDLSSTISSDLDIPPSNQKLLISPKPGLLRPPFKDPSLRLSTLVSRRIILLGSTTSEVADLTASIESIKQKQAARSSALRAGRKVQVSHYRDSAKIQDESTYTFHGIKPLPYLPQPDKSHRFLERLASDPGIKASMRKHKFSVGLLTEMDPAAHTTHEGMTLGLNRNAGQVIELRLRTDARDGYRDYKIIRKTLCHELAHNVWGPHDANFWKLCREIEGEVDKADWTRGGKSVGGEEFFNPDDEGVDEEADGGGWSGGEYVLGAGPESTTGEASAAGQAGMGMREVLARAAEERMKRQQRKE